jgi:hypothetical protein
MLNSVLMLTEADELTYASLAFRKQTPRTLVWHPGQAADETNPVTTERRLEAIQVRCTSASASLFLQMWHAWTRSFFTACKLRRRYCCFMRVHDDGLRS